MHVHHIMTGALAMAFAIAGLFFLRFLRDTNDRLFGLFALSFFILAINRVGLALADDARGSGLYWVRLAAFGLILVAIVDKNRSRSNSDTGPGKESAD